MFTQVTDYYIINNHYRNCNLGISRTPLKAKRTRAPAYSRALQRVKGVVEMVVHGKLRFDFQKGKRRQSSCYGGGRLDSEDE